MPAILRPSRLDVTDRYPMLAFTLQSPEGPRIAEVVLASDLALFSKPEGRRSDNFFSSREHGILTVPPGGAVYTVPPLVLARFITANRLYFALATASAPGGQDWRIDVMPGEASPYVSLSGLSDRALRRVRMFPASTRGRMAAPPMLMEWAGDKVTQPAPAGAIPAAAPGAGPAAAAPTPYNDGFGPLPPLQNEAPAASAPAPTSDPVPTAQGLGGDSGIDPETRGIEQGTYTEAVAPVAASALDLTAADYPRTARIVPSPAFTSGRAGTAIDRIVIHITDAPTTSSTVNTFSNAGAQASAHYLVGQDGEIVQFVSEADTAWHARGANRRSVGIEHVAIKAGGADYPRRDGSIQHFDALPPTDTQYCESAALVSYLCQKYGLTADRTTIIGHNEADPTTTHGACPTGNWDWDHFMRLVTEQVCAAQPTGQSLATSLAMDGGPETVELRYRSFIPSPLIKGPASGYDLPLGIASGEDFSGDNRGFSYDQGTSRADITALVDVAANGALSNLRIVSRQWGDSKSYDSTYTYHVEGKPDWWVDRHAGLESSRHGTLGATNDNLNAEIGFGSGIFGLAREAMARSERASGVTITVAGALPLVSPSPDIDANVTVLIRPGATGLEVRAFGGHDGFPAHELYVNGVAIHTYDPVAAGKGPGSLVGSSDIDVNSSWTPLTRRTSAAAHGLAGAYSTSTDPEDGEISGPVHEIDPTAPAQTASALALTDAEYPDAIVMPSPAFTRGRAGQAIDRIVIHITSSRQSPYLGSWFTRPDANSSAHYMVDQLGVVRQFVSEADTSWHAGNRTANRRSIGIEHVAVEQGGAVYGETRLPYTPPSDIEYQTSAGLVAHLCRKYNLTPDRTTIIGHSEVNPTTTHSSCPNGAWDWERYMALVTVAYALQTGVSAVGSVVNTVRGAVGLSADDWSINWDEVQMIPQPTDMGCWATAAAIVIGWRDRTSVSPSALASCINLERQMQDGLTPPEVSVFANASGLTVEPNACYTPDGFAQLIEYNGPIWVAAVVNAPVRFFHAVVVTGMYRANGAYFVRVTDPLDRVVGSPGSPGARTIPPTHSTGSRYIMTYEDFTSEFEAAAGIGVIQLMHSAGTHGHTINRGSASGAGYAQGLARGLARGFGDEAVVKPAIVATPAPVDVAGAVTRATSSDGGRSYDLAQLAGMIRPANALAGGAGMAPIPGERVMLTDWPYIDSAGGRVQAGLAIDWKFDGAAVGDIAIAPAGGSVADGWIAAVRADIVAGSGTPDRTALLVRVTTIFSLAGQPDQTGVSEVTLGGDGRAATRHCGDGTEAPAKPPATAAPVPQPVPAREPVTA